MNSLDILDHLARILLSVSWQVSILILLVWIVSLITRKSSSEFRYWLWIIVLVRLCIPVGLEIPFGIPTADNLLKEPVLSLVQTPFLPQHDIVVPSVPKITETTAKPVQPLVTPPGETPSWQFSINHLIAFIWLAGIIVIGLAIVWRVTRLGKRLRKCPPILNPDVQLRLAQLKTRMKITQPVGLFYLDLLGITSPAVSGVFHPRIYLPRTMDDSWSSEDLESVLLHELAHIRCYDAIVNWLQIVIQTVYFFHPLVWLANWKIRQLREEVCDDLAIHHYPFKKERYTQGMINVIKNRMREPAFTFLGLGFIERKLSLSERVRRIMNDGYKKYSRLTVTSVLILSVIGLAGISFSSVNSSKGKEVSVRKVSDIWAVEGTPSPDGRYLSFTDWNKFTGDLAIYEIATGKKRKLTNTASSDSVVIYANYSRWSPDGKQIVYDWIKWDDYPDFCIIRLDDSESSKPRIFYNNKEGAFTQTCGWSPDGKQVLACLSKKDGQNQIVLITVADGSVRVLKTLDTPADQRTINYFPFTMCFSPDGRFIAYDFLQKDDPLNRDISVLLTDGNRESPLIEHPADDYLLGWAPDGKNILFASNRGKSVDAWLIRVSNGKPQGAPEMVKRDIGQAEPVGFTRNGSFYYHQRKTQDSFISIGEFDPKTGIIITPPKKVISRLGGYLLDKEYSPDGKYLAYITGRGGSPSGRQHPNVLYIYSLETGKEQEFSPKLKSIEYINGSRWSPDGSSILVVGRRGSVFGIYQLNIQTGIFTCVVPPPKDGELFWHEWSRNGKAFFLGRHSKTNNLSQILLREIESGTEKEIYRASYDFVSGLSCSPDGKWLAYITRGKNAVLGIMPVTGGKPRELYRCEQETGDQTLRWTPDGKYILFEKKQTPESGYSLWRIPMTGGEPQKLGIERSEKNGRLNLSFHPDGRHYAQTFSENVNTNIQGAWVMENFLPK